MQCSSHEATFGNKIDSRRQGGGGKKGSKSVKSFQLKRKDIAEVVVDLCERARDGSERGAQEFLHRRPHSYS